MSDMIDIGSSMVKQLYTYLAPYRERVSFEIADYLENTDLPIALGDIFDSIYDDTPVEDVLKQLKDMGYDEKFYEESFQDLEGNYLLPNFDPSSYETMMEYYVHDLLNYEDYHDQLGISDGVIYRMLQNNR